MHLIKREVNKAASGKTGKVGGVKLYRSDSWKASLKKLIDRSAADSINYARARAKGRKMPVIVADHGSMVEVFDLNVVSMRTIEQSLSYCPKPNIVTLTGGGAV